MKNNNNTKTRPAHHRFGIKYRSEIGGKWAMHPQTPEGGWTWAQANAKLKSFTEIKAEIVPYSPKQKNEPMNWLMIPAAI